MEKRWRYCNKPSPEAIEALSRQININPYLSSILIQRGISTFEEAKNFFRPSLEKLHDPFLMKDMATAVDRLRKAIESHEKILIYGDYDVDGTTAVALVYSYLRTFYNACEIYIPDRYAEGYGVSRTGVEWAHSNGFSLIIALDCGIKSFEMVELARNYNVDFIICDHHLPGTDVPAATAILDPKQSECGYPFKELSGCGIGFKLMQAYALRYRTEEEVFNYLDLVAVSVASDVVPITDENRILTFFGTQKLNTNPVPGLKALMDIAGLKNDLDVSGIIFTLGPRINAAGRIDQGSAAVRMLAAQSLEEAKDFAEKLNINNEQRKEFDSSITKEALSMIEDNEMNRLAKSTVLFKDTWHKGVIGIVAARCVEKYYRPTVILTESNDKLTGSARSVQGFDLYRAICECGDLLEKFGGHKYAAGLTLDKGNLLAFQQRFEEVVASNITPEMLTPVIDIDAEVEFDAITPKFLNILKQMGPFGPENVRPVFVAHNVRVVNSLTRLKEKHIRFLAGQENNNAVFQVIGFNLADLYEKLMHYDRFSIAFTVEENSYNGFTSIQLQAKDIANSSR
ncbi:MAG TPA: single-stranded-DNA-specific exonuclease RecJ [Cyclobacteriaceae bacterium]|nr:single-stranded-DNA-specific exonuclease RecJ [Cyclobacteriaceae bacterium]